MTRHAAWQHQTPAPGPQGDGAQRENTIYDICMLLYSPGTKFLDDSMRVQVFPVYFDSFYLSFGLFMFMENTPEEAK